jgi:glycosyltransferase involved in cell wall biosynthesis
MTAEHIALILHDFSTGGSERIAIRLANRWAASGRRVTLLCGTEQGAARSLVSPQVRVEICTPETPRSLWSRLLLGWRFAKLVRIHRPDVVFAPGNFHLVILASLARKHFIKRPIFASKLSNPLHRVRLRTWFEKLANAAIRKAAKPVDVLVAMSPSLKIEANYIFRGHAVSEISEPILDDLSDSRRPISKRREAPLILCAGRLCSQKDFSTALKAFAEISPLSRARLLILGEGPLRNNLRDEATRLGIASRVDMPGHVTDIGNYLAKADIFLMTSQFEGYPAVLIEAMAAGLPIVTTNCSLAINEIMALPGLGRVVNSRHPIAIAAAITAQLAEPMPDISKASNIVERHRIGASSDAYLALFDRMVA